MQEKFAKEISWDHDREQFLIDRAKFYKVGCIVLALIAVSEGLGITAIMPLTQIETHYIRVDNVTGVIDTYKQPDIGTLSDNEIIREAMFKKYIRICEEYHYETAQEDSKHCNMFNEAGVGSRYAAYVDRSNPMSPSNLYDRNASVRVMFKSSSRITDYANVYSVRYLKQVIWKDSSKPVEISHWVATVSFKFTNEPSKDVDLEINPLNMLVYEYRNDPESVNKPGVKP